MLICFCCLCPCCFYISLYREEDWEVSYGSIGDTLFGRYDDFQGASKVLKSKDFAPGPTEYNPTIVHELTDHSEAGSGGMVADTADSEFVAVEMVNFTDLHSTSVQEVES